MNRRHFLALPAAAVAPSRAYSFIRDNPFAGGSLTPRKWKELVEAKLREFARNPPPGWSMHEIGFVVREVRQ